MVKVICKQDFTVINRNKNIEFVYLSFEVDRGTMLNENSSNIKISILCSNVKWSKTILRKKITNGAMNIQLLMSSFFFFTSKSFKKSLTGASTSGLWSFTSRSLAALAKSFLAAV